MSLLIRGATLLDLDPCAVNRADLRIAGGRIVEVGATLPVRPCDEVMDLDGAWILPGLVNAHHHLYSALATGMPLPEGAASSFADMLTRVWWRMDQALDLESVRACGLVGGLAELSAGVTTVIDHHASPGCIEDSLETLDAALDEVGLRRVLCYEVTDRHGPDGARRGVEAHLGLIRAGRADGMRSVLVGGHASFTLSDDTLRRMVTLAQVADVGLHVHVAEAVDDAALTGEPVVSRLRRLGALRPGSVFAHGVHLSAEELRQIEDAGAVLTHQPRSNMNNAVGYAPLASFGENTAIGTDGIVGGPLADLACGYFRSQEAGAGWGPNRWVQALARGARLASDLLGVRLGVLQPDAEADLIVLDAPPGPPLSAASLPATLVFRMRSSMIRHVMVAGRWRLWDRAPTVLNIHSLQGEAERASLALWARMRALPPPS